MAIALCLSPSFVKSRRGRSGQSLKAEQFERVFKAWDAFLLVLKSAVEALPEEEQVEFLSYVEQLPRMTEEDLQALQIKLNRE